MLQGTAFRVDNVMFNRYVLWHRCKASWLHMYGKQYQSTLIPEVASTPHGPANFMSLGRI